MNVKELEIEVLDDEELPEGIHQMATQKIHEADEEIKQMRMQIHWGIQQVEVVKRAAKLIGIPYHAYIKQTLFQQAIQDIERAENLLHRQC